MWRALCVSMMTMVLKKVSEWKKNCFLRKYKLEEVNKHELLKNHRNCVKFVKAWEERYCMSVHRYWSCWSSKVTMFFNFNFFFPFRQHLYIQTELCEMRWITISCFKIIVTDKSTILIWNMAYLSLSQLKPWCSSSNTIFIKGVGTLEQWRHCMPQSCS